MKEAIVVGGGLAGLSCAMKLAELGVHVKIVSLTKVKRSHSVCAQGGMNVAVNLMGENDSVDIHAYDTIKGGDFLVDQAAAVEMCYNGPHIVKMMDNLGVPFNRKTDKTLDFRRFGGTLYNRTCFAGASTGQQLIYALDEQVRRAETKGLVDKYENHEFMRLVTDGEGICRGIVMMDIFTMEMHTLKADAVVLAAGGVGMIFKLSTNSTHCLGAATARAYMQGALIANPEFIQIHPTAIPGHDKCRLMSESARGEGGRVWVYGDSSKTIIAPDGNEIPCGKTGEPWYFLEEMYPAFGNLVPRDVASREIIRVTELGLGIDGGKQVYLDLTHLSPEKQHKLEAILEIYEKFTGENPRVKPMKIFPAMHYTMGGLWVDWPEAEAEDRMLRYRHMTNIPGLFACGECDYQYHGANRLGANSLLSCIYSGLVTGNEITYFVDSLEKRCREISDSYFEEARSKEIAIKQEVMSRDGPENVYQLHDELSDIMISKATVVRTNEGLKEAIAKIKELKERLTRITVDDRGTFANQGLAFAMQFGPMLEYALCIVKGALMRDEFRGAHFKAGFDERDDNNWLKTTICTYRSDLGEPDVSYRKVDTSYIDPIQRDYTKAKRVIPKWKKPIPKIAIATAQFYRG